VTNEYNIEMGGDTPDRIFRLPRDERGLPIPWFVDYVDGKPEFRAMDSRKIPLAIKFRICWVCGGPMGRHMAFLVGPMCSINRISAEPPSHVDCALWSAKNCPFLTTPARKRREKNMPEGAQDAAGVMIKRNPGVALVWVTKSYQVMDAGNGLLFRIGKPESVAWFAEGRKAERGEILDSMLSGLPLLQEAAMHDGREALRVLDQQYIEAMKLVPA
jgi:hypothetical protein